MYVLYMYTCVHMCMQIGMHDFICVYVMMHVYVCLQYTCTCEDKLTNIQWLVYEIYCYQLITFLIHFGSTIYDIDY